MVKLDTQESRDQAPMLYHALERNSNLHSDYEVDQKLERLTSDKFREFVSANE